MKKKFIVEVREVHVQPFKVEADSKAEAIETVKEGGGEIIENAFKYSHTLDSEYWTAEEKC